MSNKQSWSHNIAAAAPSTESLNATIERFSSEFRDKPYSHKRFVEEARSSSLEKWRRSGLIRLKPRSTTSNLVRRGAGGGVLRKNIPHNFGKKCSGFDSSGDDPRATRGLVSNLAHPRVNKTKHYTALMRTTSCAHVSFVCFLSTQSCGSLLFFPGRGPQHNCYVWCYQHHTVDALYAAKQVWGTVCHGGGGIISWWGVVAPSRTVSLTWPFSKSSTSFSWSRSSSWCACSCGNLLVHVCKVVYRDIRLYGRLYICVVGVVQMWGVSTTNKKWGEKKSTNTHNPCSIVGQKTSSD